MENEVEERLAILELTARYADCADQKDWSALTSLFLADAVFDAQAVYGATYNGSAEILHFYEHAPLATGHHPTGVYTDFEGDDQARTRIKMLVLFTRAIFTVDYDWELKKTAGSWQIGRLTIHVVGRNDLYVP